MFRQGNNTQRQTQGNFNAKKHAGYQGSRNKPSHQSNNYQRPRYNDYSDEEGYQPGHGSRAGPTSNQENHFQGNKNKQYFSQACNPEHVEYQGRPQTGKAFYKEAAP